MQASPSPPPARYSDGTRVEKLLRRHHAIPLEHRSVLHHELNVAQRVDVCERITRDRDQVREQAWLDRTALLDDIGRLVAVDGHRAQDVSRGDTCRLPGLDEGDCQIATA